jgi:ethanolamine utilization protein EutN
MRLARVVGNVVATVKSPGLARYKLLLVRHVDPSDPSASESSGRDGEVYAAIDRTGAGDGDVVLVTQGSAARVDEGTDTVPTDATVVAIVDSVLMGTTTTFKKG